jgi:hypothetical protein
MKSLTQYLALYLFIAAAALAADLKIGTLNTYLFFDPAINHPGKVDDGAKMSADDYRTKIANLATLVKGYNIVALQETGGRAEITALANAAGMSWLWTKGKDTATGQEVGILFELPGWKVVSKGRVPELDRVVSKHLLAAATKGAAKVYVLAVHLLRPIGTQAEKQAKQREAIGMWAKALLAREPEVTIVVAGDTNCSDRRSLYGVGSDAGDLNAYAATHLAGKCFDRLVVVGPGKWASIEIKRPLYGPRPNDANKRLWTDHYFVGATLRLE